MFETKDFFINPSLTHDESWIFKAKDGSGWFSINATERYMKATYGKNS